MIEGVILEESSDLHFIHMYNDPFISHPAKPFRYFGKDHVVRVPMDAFPVTYKVWVSMINLILVVDFIS